MKTNTSTTMYVYISFRFSFAAFLIASFKSNTKRKLINHLVFFFCCANKLIHIHFFFALLIRRKIIIGGFSTSFCLFEDKKKRKRKKSEHSKYTRNEKAISNVQTSMCINKCINFPKTLTRASARHWTNREEEKKKKKHPRTKTANATRW